MKLLHVSDWHLGRQTYRQSRVEDHDAVLMEILDIARDSRPHLILHTGDLFDGMRPPASEMVRATDSLRQLAELAPVVVIAGNHDSPTLFHVFNRLLGDSSSIRFVDRARPANDGGILTFPGEDGEVIRLASVPFIHANRFVEFFEKPGSWTGEYAKRVHAVEQALGRGLGVDYNGSRDILIFAAHLYVEGARFSGSERPLTVSANYASRVERIPHVSYAAFGHIHRPQELPGGGGRYAGSPIQLDFGEQGEVKEVVLVETAPGVAPHVRPIALRAGRPLVLITGALDELPAMCEGVGRALFRVVVRTEQSTPDLAERVRDLLEEATILDVIEDCAETRIEALTKEETDQSGEESLRDLFQEFLTTKRLKGVKADRVLSVFSTVIDAVETESELSFPEDELLTPIGFAPAAEETASPEEEFGVRPVRLNIEGLRSFRTARAIDFTNLGLVAIVGDTGAGKSSILEAITYALYNGSTWDRQNTRALITDGLNTMKVEFDFTADAETWRVIRSTSKSGYPPPIHSLQCLSDPERPKVDGETAVGIEIRRLVGLDYETFCSAVILPQGRFQALLQASAGDRTKILKSIFRLDLLSDARDAADARLGVLQPHVEAFRIERGMLSENPQADTDELARVVEQHRKAADKLDAARKALAEFVEAERHAIQASAPLRAYLDELHQLASPAKAFAALIPQVEALDSKSIALDEREKQAAEAVAHEEQRISEAAAKGESKQALDTGVAALERVAAEQRSTLAEGEEIEKVAQAIVSERTELERDAAGRDALATSVEEAKTERDRRTADATTAGDAVSAATAALGECRGAAERVAASTVAVDAAAGELANAKTQLDSAMRRVKETHKARDEARAGQQELERAHAAAHLAVGLVAGDPCPICARELPAGFHPPDVPGLEEANAKAEATEAAWESAKDAAARGRANIDHAQARLAGETKRRDGEQEALARAQKVASEQLGTSKLDRPDAQLLRALQSRLESATVQVAAAETTLRQKEQLLVEFDAKLKPRRDGIEGRQADLDRRRGVLVKTVQRLAAEREHIPEAFRPEVRASDFESARTSLDARLSEVSSWHKALETANSERAAIGRERADLRTRRDRLAEPRQNARDELLRALEALNDGARLIGDPVAPTPQLTTIQQEATVASTIEDRTGALSRAVDAAIVTRAKDAEKARTAATQLLDSLGVETAAELENTLIARRAEERHAAAEEARVRAQIPVAAELDRRLGPLSELHVALTEICRLLRDAQFVAFAVQRKQLALLGTASEILGTMTGDRYGFSKGFEIVDKLSGQPRSPRTLSGGESFLASLALALSLVEMAARSGGRLEALFLDEGFGSLDADALDEALGELERRASAGQLIGLISHVSAVAERIETVIRVDRTAEGSVVRLVDQSGRWQLVEQELENGLLA